MKVETLRSIEPVLAVLRASDALVEVKPTVFDHRGRNFIHFHEEPEGVVADVRLARGRIRLPVDTQADQAALLEAIDETLSRLVGKPGAPRRRRQRAQGDDP